MPETGIISIICRVLLLCGKQICLIRRKKTDTEEALGVKELWKKFDQLSSQAYSEGEQGSGKIDSWNEGFTVLKEIMKEGRGKSQNFVRKFEYLDEATNYTHNVGEWLEDYLEKLGSLEMYGRLEEVCSWLLDEFEWGKDTPSDLNFQMATALASQGKHREALEYCENWYAEENENVVAATALIYARTSVMDFQGAEEIVKKYITEDGKCTEDNDLIYMAASLLYKVSKNEKAEEKINQELQRYEKEME